VRYGLARALLRSGAVDGALKEVEAIRSSAPASPFVESLYAEIKLAQREPTIAVAVYEAALKQFPEHVALRYGMLDALLQAGRAADASAAARAATSARRDDIRMWALQSRAEAALGRKTAHHRAQAEVYVLKGSLPAAIEQLELARRAGDGDFFELSAADARMRELKAEHEVRRREQQR
jgi:predicted Zn-dependent protease